MYIKLWLPENFYFALRVFLFKWPPLKWSQHIGRDIYDIETKVQLSQQKRPEEPKPKKKEKSYRELLAIPKNSF